MKVTKTDIQMRFADVDSLGHVNNVNQQHYFDLGKSDFFKEVLGVDRVSGSQGLITASTTTSYLGQTRLRDEVYVQTEIQKVGNKSMTLFQQLIDRASGEVRAESTSVMVAFNFDTQESISIPDQWRKSLSA